MDAMELMAICRRHAQDAERLKEQIEELEYGMVRCGGGIGKALVKESMGDHYAAYAARRDELEGRLHETARRLAAEQTAAILITEAFPAAQRRALRKFYVYGDSASAIAAELSYTVSNIYKLMHAARESLARIPDDLVMEKLPGWYAAAMGKEENERE